MDRDESINKLIQLSNNKKSYHYITVFLCLLMAVNMNIFNVGIIYLKKVCQEKNTTYSIPKMNENKNCNFSILHDFEYENDAIIGVFGAFPYIGNYIFGLLFSPLTDYIGHKLSIFAGGASYIIFLSLCVLIHHFWIIFAFLILSQISANLMLYSSLFLGQELATSSQRAFIGSIINTGFCLSGLLHLLYFHFNFSYKLIFAIDICVTSFLLIPFNYWIYDSPRYYLEHHQTEEGLAILEKISSFNQDKDQFQQAIKKKEYQKIIKSLTKGTEEEKNSQEEAITYSIRNLFKYRSIYKPMIILSLIWFCTAFIYNGIAFILEWEDWFMEMLTVIVYCIEGTSYFIIGQLINIRCLGRKKVTYLLFFAIAVFIFIMLLIQDKKDEQKYAITGFSIFVSVCRFSFSGIFTILYTYTPECYPKGFKTGCFGINVLSAALGSAVMSLCVSFSFTDNRNLFYYTGGTMALICGIVTLFLEETIDKPFMYEIKEIAEMKEKAKIKEEKRKALFEKIERESQVDDMLLPN